MKRRFMTHFEAFIFLTYSKTCVCWQSNFLLLSGSTRQIKYCYFRPPRSAVQHPLKKGRVCHVSLFVTPTIPPGHILTVTAAIPSFFRQNSIILLCSNFKLEQVLSDVAGCLLLCASRHQAALPSQYRA
jgi:hypothetical protein